MLKKLLRALGLSKKVPRTDKPIGVVTHYYGGVSVAIVKFNREIKTGANVTFQGVTTDFSQTINSMEFDHKKIDSAPAGKEIGIKVKDKVREDDGVYLNA
ncbi:MAG: translation elongation factor-like protein [bacterium]|nr:translation elongation factor-like protein [bacterium]